MHRLSFLLLIALAACSSGQPPVTRLSEPAPLAAATVQPEGAPDGTCWHQDETPAVIETVTHRILIDPGVDEGEGGELRLPRYETITARKIAEDRKVQWIETPCPDLMTLNFIASLQRALNARGLYRGEDHGVLDEATQSAIRAFQVKQGLDSPVLSLDAARRLGLIAVTPA